MASKKQKISNVPNLRFPGFSEEWEVKKLGDVAKFSKGKGISKSDIEEGGTIECIRYGELYTHYKEVVIEIKSRTNVDKSNLVFSEANDVIIPSSGETQIDIATASCVLNSGVALGGDLNIIKTDNNGVFLSYYLNSKKKMEIANLAQGISVVHLYSSQLASLKMNFPSLAEQSKIASFLSLLNERIQTQNKIIEQLETLIKGLNEKLLTQKIHFKDENGTDFPEWEARELREVLYYEQPTKYLVDSAEYDDSYAVPVLTAGKTFILGYSKETHGIFTENLPVIIFDDFTTAIKFVDFPFKVKSSAMKILLPKKGVNIYYVFEAMKSIDYTIGGHERHWISKYSKIEIPLPCSEEQNKIANSLTCINEKIETEKNILVQYEALKRFLLMNLFI